MLSRKTAACCAAVLLGLGIFAVAQTQSPNPDFDTVTQKLDKGGTFYMYANLEGVLDRTVTSMQPYFEQSPSTARWPEIIRRAIKAAGLGNLNDLGVSVLPIDDKVSQAKFYLALQGGPQGLFRLRGSAPRELESIKLAPADSTFAQAIDVQFNQILPVLRDILKSVGAPEAEIGKALGSAKQRGFDVEAILASIDREVGGYVRLDRENRIELGKSVGDPLTVPVPHMAVYFKTKDATLHDTLVSRLTSTQSKATHEQIGDTSATVVTVPENKFKIKPTIAQVKSWFVIATSPDEVRRVAETINGGKNITSSPEFIALKGDLPSQVNSIMYVSSAWAEEVINFSKQLQGSQFAGWKLMLGQMATASANSPGRLSISVSEPNGIYWITRGSVRPVESLQAAVAAPVIVPILAAVAVPNYLEAGVRSKVSRVRSDMRSMATGLEAYYVDWNKYPDSTTDTEKMLQKPEPGDPVVSSFVSPALTTPIAYLTQLYPDSFFAGKPGRTFGYYQDKNGWMLFSPGPDKKFDLGWEVYDSSFAQPSKDLLLYFYDPTNGTVSGGDIVRVKQ